MSFKERYYAWQMQCVTKTLQRNVQHKNILKLLFINELEKHKKRRYNTKRYWIHPIFQKRIENGFYHAIFPVISLERSRFRNYFRMNLIQFEELLNLVAPFITKQTVIREPISAAERLCLTLRLVNKHILLPRAKKG